LKQRYSSQLWLHRSLLCFRDTFHRKLRCRREPAQRWCCITVVYDHWRLSKLALMESPYHSIFTVFTHSSLVWSPRKRLGEVGKLKVGEQQKLTQHHFHHFFKPYKLK